jgi:hypothetical protein
MSRNSVFGTATSYGLDERGVGVRVLVGSRIFSSPRRPDFNFNFNFISFPLILIGLSQPKDIEQVKNTYIYK